MQKPYSIIVLFTFFQQSTKEDTFLWVFKSLRTPHGWAAWKLERLWIWHDNPISAADIGLLCQLHMLLYTECVFIGLA